MKDGFTSISVIIDASGSMQPLAAETITGFNTFLKEQQELPGDAVLSLATFSYSAEYKLVYDCVPLKEVKPITAREYRPSGGTALLDALGRTVNSVGTKLAAMKEEDRPSKVLFLIMTDGEENASTEFVREKIADMVKHQQEKYSWQFVFLGANMDAITAGSRIGIAATTSYNYTPTSIGTKQAYASITRGVSNFRSSLQGAAFTMPNPTATPDPKSDTTPADTTPVKVSHRVSKNENKSKSSKNRQ